jgi:hypothetical protein
MIQVLFLIAIWIIPIFISRNAYLKMNNEEQTELKNPFVLFGVGFIVIGLLLGFSGIILALKFLQHIGAFMVFISWFTTSIVNWKKGKTNSVKSAALVLLGVVGIVVYSYLNLI